MSTGTSHDLSTTRDGQSAGRPAPLGPGVGGSPGLWSSVGPRLWLVIPIVVILTVAGVVFGASRPPKYASNARLAIQHFNFGANGAASGFSTTAPALADTYARSIHADGVIDPLVARLHVSHGKLVADLSAVAVPQSPVFTITATTSSPRFSVALAGAAAAQLQTYEQGVNQSNPTVGILHHQLSVAESQLASAESDKNAVLGSISQSLAASGHKAPSTAQRAALAKAQASVSIAQDSVTTLRTAYAQNFVSASVPQYINPITIGSSATSDRKSRVELYGFIGLVLGIALGVGLAVMLEALRRRRRLA